MKQWWKARHGDYYCKYLIKKFKDNQKGDVNVELES